MIFKRHKIFTYSIFLWLDLYGPSCSNTLWISGGSYAESLNSKEKIFSSSDFIQLNGITQGPDLPIALYGHSMVNMNNNITIMIGGYTTL